MKAAVLALVTSMAAGSAAAVAVTGFGAPNAGWNVGSGQPPGGFALTTENETGLQIGLRSQDYQIGISSNDGVSNYFVTAGERSPGSGLALWNIDFSLDGNGTQLRTLDLSLTIDWDPGAGTNLRVYDLDAPLRAANSTIPLLQASENLGFAYWGQPFNPFATGTYVFTLTMNDPESGGARLSRSINVNVAAAAVPEPMSLALVLAALGGVAATRRRG